MLISGFTHPDNEFRTPGRVINWHSCHSCWNDPRERFDHNDFLWCPRQKNTQRQFECTRLITADAVIAATERVLGAAGDRAREPRLPIPATPARAMSTTGTAP